MTSLEDRFLLPLDYAPKRYKIRLEPDLGNFTFGGVVEIQVEKKNATSSITLNVADITIQSAQFTTASGVVIPTTNIAMNEKDERVVFTFASQLTENGTLRIEYKGELNDKMKGFYRSAYTWQGEKRFMATTQFEANDARRAFPCWDEPERKAVFELELVVDRHLTALGNMNVTSTHSEPNSGKKVVQFAPTPIMSTYLVAFCIGEYDYIETTVQLEKGPHTLRVYTVPGKSHLGQFSLEVGAKVIPNLEKFFGVDFPYPKTDMIALPEFAAGAMENIGLITYRETALLFDPVSSSLNTKQYCALVVAHELGHMYFGNLVTMKWWSALWLNEGFATWLEYVMVDQIFPEWEMFNQFVQLDVGNAFLLDSMESSHPVSVPIRRAEEVDEVFDAISYNKACAIIYMLADYITVDAFKKALNIYLNRFAWKNADPVDLWDAITEVVGSDIATLMTGWTDQTGYPVIEVHPATTSSGERAIRVRQRRFLQKGLTDDQTQWRVPISFITDSVKTPQYVVLTKEEDIIPVPKDAKLIKINAKQTGFYRVQYAEEMLPALVEAIRNQDISSIDRLGVLTDVSALAKAGYIPARNALTIFSAFENEEDFIVVKALATNLLSFYNIIKRNEKIEPLFREFGHGIFVRLGSKLGWDAQEGESELDTLTRTTVLSVLRKLEHPETIKTGMDRFRAIAKAEQKNVVAPDLLGLVYAIGLSEGGREEYDAVLNIFRGTDLNEERVRVLGALGHTKDEEILAEILKKEFVLDEVKAQDLMYPLSGVASNKKGGREKVWDWFVNNYESIRKRVDNGFLFGRILKVAASEFDTMEHKTKVEEFLSTKELPQLKRSIAQVIEGIELSAATRERVEESVTPIVLQQLIDQQKK